MSVVLFGAWIAQCLAAVLFACCLLGIVVLLVDRLMRANRHGGAAGRGKLNLAPLPIRWLDAMIRRPVPVRIAATTASRAPPAVRPGRSQPPPGFTASGQTIAPPLPGPDPR